jgi:phytoene synthase
MQDAFAYCAELVRQADRDRFLAALFAPPEARDALLALYAFNVEITRVRDAAREPLAGEIRLQWWSEVLAGGRADEAGANPVAAALLIAMERHGLPANALSDLIEAHRFDLYDDPMVSIADLESYTARTFSALIALAARILGADATPAAEPAGVAYGITGVLRSFPLHTARRQLYVPEELLTRHGVHLHDVFAGKSSPALDAVLTELRGVARDRLVVAREPIIALPPGVLPAFLPVALVRHWLDRLERDDAFTPSEISPWRRQWLIWRAARDTKRIAR